MSSPARALHTCETAAYEAVAASLDLARALRSQLLQGDGWRCQARYSAAAEPGELYLNAPDSSLVGTCTCEPQDAEQVAIWIRGRIEHHLAQAADDGPESVDADKQAAPAPLIVVRQIPTGSAVLCLWLSGQEGLSGHRSGTPDRFMAIEPSPAAMRKVRGLVKAWQAEFPGARVDSEIDLADEGTEEPAAPAKPMADWALADGTHLELPVEAIVIERNYRKTIDQERLEELAANIRQHGIVQPVVVRPIPERPHVYGLVAGERRWRAAQIPDQDGNPTATKLSAIIRHLTPAQVLEIQLTENVHREDTAPLDEALALQEGIQELGWTREQIMQRLGRSVGWVSERLGLLDLPEVVQEAVGRRGLAMKSALALRPFLPPVGTRLPSAVEALAKHMADDKPAVAGVSGWMASQLRSVAKTLNPEPAVVCGYHLQSAETPDYLGNLFALDAPLAGKPACDACPYQVQSGKDYAGNTLRWCLQPACWNVKQRAVWRVHVAEREAQNRAAEQPQRGQATPAAAGAAPVTPAQQRSDPEAAPLVDIFLEAEPAGPIPGADPDAAAALRHIAADHWPKEPPRDGVDYERESYLPLEALLEHWRLRSGCGASQMPRQIGAGTTTIPEQEIVIRGGDPYGGGCISQERHGPLSRLLIHTDPTDIRDDWPGMVYYRVQVGPRPENTTTREMRQALVIPCADRHLVLVGTSHVIIRKELVARWHQLMNALPAMPELSTAARAAGDLSQDPDVRWLLNVPSSDVNFRRSLDRVSDEGLLYALRHREGTTARKILEARARKRGLAAPSLEGSDSHAS